MVAMLQHDARAVDKSYGGSGEPRFERDLSAATSSWEALAPQIGSASQLSELLATAMADGEQLHGDMVPYFAPGWNGEYKTFESDLASLAGACP